MKNCLNPRLVELPPMALVGVIGRYRGAGAAKPDAMVVVSQIWGRFMLGRGRLPVGMAGVRWGASRAPEDPSAAQAGERDYLAGVELAPSSGNAAEVAGAGLTHWSVPALTCVAVTHQGPIGALPATLSWLYERWLPDSPFDALGTWELERYDERFKLGVADSAFDFHVAVRRR